ncbi:MAG: UMP kinase [Clostridia bacterium]
MLKYKRIVLKISGEALAGGKGFGIDNNAVDSIVEQLKTLYEQGLQIGLVVGGGNFWRGRQGEQMDRAVADHMGMLATVINALAIQDALEAKLIPVRVQTSLEIKQVAEPYILRKALSHLQKGRIVIFACGTGSPYFTTDTAAALRSAELHADCLLCAKAVDGVYSSDPKIDITAKKYSTISYMDVISKNLHALDTTAISMCMENKIPILVFALADKNSIINAVEGKNIGTIIE